MKIPFRWKIPIVARITIGLVGLMVSVLMLVSLMGLFPDSRASLMRGRVIFCESAAAGFSLMAEKADANVMRSYLEMLAKNNPDVQSLGVRRDDGNLVVEIGDHAARWDGSPTEKATESQIWVRYYADGRPWGRFEAAFAPLDESGYLAALQRPEFAYSLVATVLCLGAFYVYLRIVLRHLDPSRVIPKRVREALDSLAEGLLILDRSERIVLANRAFEQSTGTTLQQLLGSSIDKVAFFSKDETPIDLAPWREAIQHGRPVTERLLGVQTECDRDCTFSVSASPIFDDQGISRGIIASFKDVTQLEQKKCELTNMVQYLRASSEAIKQQNHELERLASRDPLTSCLNRRAFFDRFDGQWSTAQRYDQPLSVLMVDIDFFKSINDDFGHSTGDEVLRQIGQTLREIARESDSVCRFGGEEFAFLLPMTNYREAIQAAERVRQSIEKLAFSRFQITASIGVSTRSAASATPEELLDMADKCLYVAKGNGRNQVVGWDDVPAELVSGQSRIQRAREDVESEPVSIPYHAVTALISALAYRDQSTAAHSRRVADLCVATAEGLMSLTHCYTLEIAALLHDIGKIGVPDSILLKPGTLSPEEWTVMRRHDRIGIEIIRASFASPVLTDIVGDHQTHFDSPDSRNRIPLGARILAIADAYDAMTTDQVFRKGRSMEEAFTELRRCAGSQFDPELVERFITTVRERPAMQLSAAGGISKETALAIGLQIEQLSKVLDEQDYDALDAMSHRLQSTALKYGVEYIGDKASELGDILALDRDPHSILQVANDLLDLCRSTQRTLLDSNEHECRATLASAISVSQVDALPAPAPI